MEIDDATAGILFDVCQKLVLGPWLLLLLVPQTMYSRFPALVAITVCGAAYTVLIAAALARGLPENASFSTLEGVRAIFASGDAVVHTACWVHYLAFDLAIGLAETELAGFLGMHRAVLFLTLPLTLMLGPAGALLFGLAAALHYFLCGQSTKGKTA